MPKKQTIPAEVQEEVQKLIDEFNSVHLKESTSLLNTFFPSMKKRGYSARFKGKYLYLDRTDRSEPLPICRLTWNGKIIGISPYINTQVRNTTLKSGFFLAKSSWMVRSLVQ